MDFFALFLIFLEASAVAGLGWESPYFTKHMENITLVGDSYLRNDIIRLTRAIDNTVTPALTWSAGAVVYKNLISLFDPQTNSASSFSTTFSFSITISKSNPTSAGDGLACFFFSPNGLSSATTKPLGLPTTFVTIEFDTRRDPSSGNPDDWNHVCVEDSLISLQKEDPMNVGIDLERIHHHGLDRL